jgi:hypothetical protein
VDRPPGPHGYGAATVRAAVRLVCTGVALRAVPRVLRGLAAEGGRSGPIPHGTTVRLWMQRLGHAVLTAPKEHAEDWAWLVDHSVQIGPERCLVILGIRRARLPPPGTALVATDLELIALVPRPSWTAPEVEAALQEAVPRTGAPRVIVDDHGGDLAGGVQLFQERHPQTLEVYDIGHKAACVLKRRLESDPRWPESRRRVGEARCAIQQTDLAFLVPPGERPKARFMNLGPLLNWGRKVLGVWDAPPAEVLSWVSAERLHEKLGWLMDLSDALDEWSQWQAVVDTAVGFVNCRGLDRAAARGLIAALPGSLRASSRAVAAELVRFVRSQARPARPEERLPGSTAVLESCFGRFKVLEKEHARGGFTGLVLALGAFLAEPTEEMIIKAFAAGDTQDVRDWCRANLGTTLFAKRKLAFQEGVTDSG